MVIRGHQRSSEVIRGHQRSSEAIVVSANGGGTFAFSGDCMHSVTTQSPSHVITCAITCNHLRNHM